MHHYPLPGHLRVLLPGRALAVINGILCTHERLPAQIGFLHKSLNVT